MPSKLENIDVSFVVRHDGVEIGTIVLAASDLVDDKDTLQPTDILREELARILLDEGTETKDLITDVNEKSKLRRTIIDGGAAARFTVDLAANFGQFTEDDLKL